MAIFKCKMCGGTLEINNNETVATCEYCGTQQTLPKLDDDRRVNLYDRANHFRRNNEFDKAMGIYEQILNEDSTDAEAYWSIVLCRYGIEYVEDPASHKRIPTVNRAQFTSIYADDDYKSALKYADVAQKEVYEQEAKAIDDIQKGILEISNKEEPFDVFICYKETDANGRRTQDSVLANDLYHQLVQEGFKVFFSRITLEDKLGVAYEPYIFAALNSAKVMVVLGTKPEYFNAVWVKNEWSRYLALIKQGKNKMLIPAYKDMDPYDLPEEFSHLQAQDMSKLGFMQDLIRGIKKIVETDAPKSTDVKEKVAGNKNADTEPLLKRAFMFLEDGDWSSANKYCEKVLDIDPENAYAYLGKLLSELRVKKLESLKDQKEPFDYSKNYQKAIRFADKKLKSTLKGYVENSKLNEIYTRAKKKMSEADELYELLETYMSHLEAGTLKELADTFALEEIEERGIDGICEWYSDSENLYEEAAHLFESVIGYLDSADLAQSCYEKRKNVILADGNGKGKYCMFEANRIYENLEAYRLRLEAGNYEKTGNFELDKLDEEGAYSICKWHLHAENLYEKAAHFFKSFDSADLAQSCYEKRKDVIISNGKYYMTLRSIDLEENGSHAFAMEDYENAIKLFEPISGWKDVDEMILICQKNIEELKPKAELEKERERLKEEQRKRENEIRRENERKEKERADKRFDMINKILICFALAILFIVMPMIMIFS